MKIVHICLCGAMTDGFNYQENILSKYHKKLGYNVTLIASQWMWNSEGKLVRTDRTNYLNADGVMVIRIPTKIGNVDSKLKVYSDLYASVEREKPDILFIHDCQFLDLLTLTKYIKHHSKVRVYIDNHVDYINGAHGWISKNILHKGLWRYCVKQIEPYVTKFYGVLPARVDFLKEMYDLPENRCELLLMGADDDLVERTCKPEVRERVREKYQIKRSDFLIVTGGKIDSWKPQTLLLMEAVKKIQDGQAKLVVFGSIADDLKAQAEALFDGNKIQYAGWANSLESYELFAAADLVVFPGMHSVYWEQVAGEGIPMVVRDIPGAHHIDLGGNVFFLQEASEIEIRTVLKKILSEQSLYDSMKKVAEIKGSQNFSYKRIAQKSIEEE